jgi:hypothetical protein
MSVAGLALRARWPGAAVTGRGGGDVAGGVVLGGEVLVVCVAQAEADVVAD